MDDCIDRWVDYLGKEKGLAPTSIKLMRSHLKQLQAEVEDPRVLQTSDIRAWLHGKPGAPATFASRLTSCRGFYRWLVITKQRIDDPTMGIQAPKKLKGMPRPVENLEDALDVLDELDVRNNVNAARIPCLKERPVGQSRAMAVVLCETGLRISEAKSLSLPVPAPDEIRIVGKGGKHAIIPLTDDARDAWDFLGGVWPVGIRATQRRFVEAGFTPHQCRHWRASSMAAAGCGQGEIQTLLRHENSDTTKIYMAFSTARVRDALAMVKKTEGHRGRLRSVS